MRQLLFKDKRALSEMVSYVLLIVIAVTISFLVFAYLKVLVPKPSPECPEDISLSITSAVCTVTEDSFGQLDLVLSNRGLWKVDGFYLKADVKDSDVKKYWLNDPSKTKETQQYLFLTGSKIGLNPGEVSPPKRYTSILFNDTSRKYEIEVLPFVTKGNSRVFCDKSILTQIIDCIQSSTPSP